MIWIVGYVFLKAVALILKSHLNDHRFKLRKLLDKQEILKIRLFNNIGKSITNLLLQECFRSLSKENSLQLRTKNKKLYYLKPTKPINKDTHIPIINLSDYKDINTDPLKHGLKHCFADKNKFVKRNIAIELEVLSKSIYEFVDSEHKEQLHEYLRSATNKFTANIYRTKDNTFNSIKHIRNNLVPRINIR